MEWGLIATAAEKVFLVLGSAGGVGWLLFRWRERVTWQESAKGQLAKIRHEALADGLRALSRMYDATVAYHQQPQGWTDEDNEQHLKALVELRRMAAAHLFLLPPEIRRAAEVLMEQLAVNVYQGEDNRAAAEVFATAVEPFMPELKRR